MSLSYVLSPSISCAERNNSYLVSTALLSKSANPTSSSKFSSTDSTLCGGGILLSLLYTQATLALPDDCQNGGTNQGLHGSVKSMLVVASELWVGTLEGWVSASLWLLDTIVEFPLALS